MKLKTRNKVDPTFNMSSMTDIVFLLLIFFILTSKIVPAGKKIDLPSGAEPVVKNATVMVSIDKQLNYSVGGEDVTKDKILARVERKLKKDVREGQSKVILINADKTIQYDYVMEVLRICSEVDGATVVLGTNK